MPTNKKRKGQRKAPPQSNGSQGHQVRSPAVRVNRSNIQSQTVHQQFLDDRKSLWQQGMEQLNTTTQKVFAEHVKTDEECKFACMEYLRIREPIKRTYNPEVGYLVSMGADEGHQLGIAASAEGDKEFEYPPTFVTRVGPNVVHVAAGGLHSLALTNDGKVFSFGVNDDHALGRGEIEEEELHLVEPITQGFSKEDRDTIVAIGAGDSHSIFLTIRGNVYQCGMCKDSDSGKFFTVRNGSSKTPMESNKYATMVLFPKSIRAIEAGESFSAAISNDGELYTWGMGQNGQLARSRTMEAPIKTSEDANAPPIYELGRNWVGEEYWTGKYETDKHGNFVLDKKTGERVKEIAYRYFPKLIQEKFLTPSPVCWAGPLCPQRKVLNVACGQLHILAVARDAGGYDTSVYSAGNSGFGQLGHGDRYERHELTKIKGLEGKLVHKVKAGTFHSLGLDMGGGAVYAWGKSDFGECGHTNQISPNDCELIPQQVAFPKEIEDERILDIAAGYSVSMAITDTNKVYTWGFGESGATGHDGDNDITRPRRLDVLERYGEDSQVFEAACGGQHSLMIVKRYANAADCKPAAKQTDVMMTDA